jgi:hypothetical protein
MNRRSIIRLRKYWNWPSSVDTRTLSGSPRGGACNGVRADAKALAHREERFLLQHVAIVHAPRSGPPDT